MNKETMQVADFLKKPYAKPETQVFAVESANIIATSTNAKSNEEYSTGDTSSWY